MAKYKLNEAGVIDTETNSSIPNAEGNRHWRAYQEWLAEGNTPDPADPEPAPLTPQEEFDARVDNDPVLKALVDQMEANNPGFRAQAKARLP